MATLLSKVRNNPYVDGDYKTKYTDKLDAHFGFESTGEMNYGPPIKIDKKDREGNTVSLIKQSKFRLIKSPLYPNVIMVGFTDERRSLMKEHEGLPPIDKHRVVFIKRENGIEYYNPNGEAFHYFPLELAIQLEKTDGWDMGTLLPNDDAEIHHYEPVIQIEADGTESINLKQFQRTTKMTPALSFLSNHQGAYPVCANACVVRAIHPQSNEVVDAGFRNREHGEKPVTPAERIIKATINTVARGGEHVVHNEPPNPANLKKGGIVKGKKGQAVPITAHAGELVVPAEVVPKVLKSSAWIDHIKSVQKKQGVSYKDAMKMAKGTYKK